MDAHFGYWLVQGGTFGAFGAMLLIGLRKIKHARLIEDTPTSSVRSAAQGYVELLGTAKPLEDYEAEPAPLTGLPCLWYHYEIYEQKQDKPGWRRVESRTSKSPFFLVDDNGDGCIIQVEGAQVKPRGVDTWYGHQRRPVMAYTAPEAQMALKTGSRYKYLESRIAVGDSLYAMGLFRSLLPPGPEEQTEKRKQLLLSQWKIDQQQLLVRFDKDGDGRIDMQEWQHAQDEALKVATEQILHNFDHRPVHTLSLPLQRSRPLIISSMIPAQLAKQYRTNGVRCLVAAIVIAVAWGLWLL